MAYDYYMPFVTDLVVKETGVHQYELVEDLVYQGAREAFVVPAGTPTDFASVPAAIRWLIPKYGKYNKCAVLHDYLCIEAHAGRFSRRDADGLFRRTLNEVGVGYVMSRLMWTGVRWGGKLSDANWKEITVILAASAVSAPLVLAGGVAALAGMGIWRIVEQVAKVVRAPFPNWG